jgi:predicted acylesterase/phospholipase RssA
MDVICQILQDIPFFRHCTDDELDYLRKISRIVSIKGEHKLDISRINSFFVVINGLFEIEIPSRGDVVYLTQGSFFGVLPFSENKHRGNIRALSDSSLLIMEIEDIYRFFLISFKALRGYIKIIDKIGFEISHTGKDYLVTNSKIVSVYSPFSDSGKSILSAYIGLSLARFGKTIILDMSYHGNSIFNIFEKKITPALSQKPVEEASREQFIYNRIVEVDENLSMLNICFGSKVKVDPDILSPILFLLSKKYRYIVFDLSDYDGGLRDKAFALSDIIFGLMKKLRDRKSLYTIVDGQLREGQRVYYVLNQYYSPDIMNLEGGLIFQDVELNEDKVIYDDLLDRVTSDRENEIVGTIRSKKRAMVFESNLIESVVYAGLLKAMDANDITIDVFYSSSMSFFILSLYLLSDDFEEFERNVVKFFSESRLNSILDITFPEVSVFKSSRIHKFASEIAEGRRIEFFETLPLVMLTDELHNRRMFSTGYFRDLIAASFLIYPVFESLKIDGNNYNSGFPVSFVRAEEILRTDIDSIIFSSVNNKDKLEFSDNRILQFFSKYLNYMYYFRSGKASHNILDKNINIEINEREFKIEKIIQLSEDISNRLVKENL